MIRSFGLALGATLALAAPAAASAADFSWTGGAGSDTPQWSNPANWGGTAPSGSVGTLSFPGGSTSADDLSGLQANALALEFGGLTVTGSPLSLGSGGITTTDPATDPGEITVGRVSDPLRLTAPQTWTINAPEESQSQLALTGGVTGASDPVALNLDGDATLVLGADSEVGPVTATGYGQLAIASDQPTGQPGGSPGALNATDGNPLTLDGVRLITAYTPAVGTVDPSGETPVTVTTGPLTSEGGDLQPTGTVAVDGNLSLDGASATILEVRGQSADQLTATGNVTVGGELLLVGFGPDLADLQPGETFPLVSATGTLSGTFANAPEGTLENIGNAELRVEIEYTPNAVIGKVVNLPTVAAPPVTAPPVTTTPPAAGNGSPPVTPVATTLAVTAALSTPRVPLSAGGPSGPAVSYTATLQRQSSGATSPTGTLVLSDNGTPIAACAQLALHPSGNAQQASCTIAKPGAGIHRITASYLGDGNFTGSISAPLTVTVPAAVTGRAVRVTASRVTLHGTVSDAGAVTVWRFEYWTAKGRPRYTTLRGLSARARPAAVSVALRGLKPGTRYRYRLITTTTGAQPVSWTGRTQTVRTRR